MTKITEKYNVETHNNYLKLINYVNEYIKSDLDRAIAEEVFNFTNNINLNIKKDNCLSYNENDLKILVSLKHSMHKGDIILSDFEYNVTFTTDNIVYRYSIDTVISYESFYNDTVYYRNGKISTFDIIEVPELKNNEYSDRDLKDKIIALLESKFKIDFFYFSGDLFPYSTMLVDSVNYVAKYNNDNLLLAKYESKYKELKYNNEIFKIIESRGF